MKNFIKKIVALGERQLGNEKLAADLIMSELSQRKIESTKQYFQTKIPKDNGSYLKIDGKRIKVKLTGLKSGKISDNHQLISSLISSQKNLKDTNINFNPECEIISGSNFYFAPALAVAAKDVLRICKAKKVDGQVKVVAKNHRSVNILVGNKANPENIIFSHYDSIGTGAIDNASGVAVMLDLIIESPELLNKALFVFAGNEELSYDYPIYWGRGYRQFEKKNYKLLQKTKKIIVVDSVGNARPCIEKKLEIIKLGFPIKNLDKLAKKIIFIYGSLDKIWPYYHSDLDQPELVKNEFLRETLNLIRKTLN